MWMIIFNNSNYNNNKQNINNKQSKEKKQTMILIYYIQVMKRLPCLICRINITFIQAKSGIYLSFMVPMQFFFALKIFPFIIVYYCDLPVINPVMVILQIMFAKTFLVMGFIFMRVCKWVCVCEHNKTKQVKKYIR